MITTRRVPVLNAAGAVVGSVAAHATSVGASKLLQGAAVRLVRDNSGGYVWQEYDPKRRPQ